MAANRSALPMYANPSASSVPETADAVADWIGGSEARARVAWDVEKARKGDNRKGVVEAVRAAGVKVKG